MEAHTGNITPRHTRLQQWLRVRTHDRPEVYVQVYETSLDILTQELSGILGVSELTLNAARVSPPRKVAERPR